LIFATARVPEAILEQAARGQLPDQRLSRPVDACEWQTFAQLRNASCCARAELPQAGGMTALETDDDVSVCARFERDVSDEAGG